MMLKGGLTQDKLGQKDDWEDFFREVNLVEYTFELTGRNLHDWEESGFEFQVYSILRKKNSH